MAAPFAPSMLTLVREAKGWTQRDLATQVGLSQAVVSKLESGALEVTPERLTRLAEVLDCPTTLLCRPASRMDSANTCLHHRRRHSKLSAAATRRIEGIAHLTRVTVEGIFDGVHVQLDTDINPEDVRQHSSQNTQTGNDVSPAEDPASWDFDDADSAESSSEFDPGAAEAAAHYVRQAWGLNGPIANLIDLLESHGILVVHRSLGTRAQDGVSSWPADLTQPPLIVLNRDLPPDRARFTLAHEFAHLLLHRFPSEHAEREANRFAAEFLAPAEEIAPALSGLKTSDLARLVRLKETWGVSIGTLVQRALDGNHISERQFREFRIRLARLGWDVNEPGTLPVEQPTLLARAMSVGRDLYSLNTVQLAEMACMTPASFERHYLRESSMPPPTRLILNADPITATASDDDTRPQQTHPDSTAETQRPDPFAFKHLAGEA